MPPVCHYLAPLFLALALVIWVPVTIAATSLLPFENAGFESPYSTVNEEDGQVTGKIANGWYNNNGYGNVVAVYSQETINPHSGTSCQKMTLSKVNSGELQIYQSVSILGLSFYTISVWLRSDTRSRAQFYLQGPGPYYPEYAWIFTPPLTKKWQKFTSFGYSSTYNVSGAIVIGTESLGNIYVDDVKVSYEPTTFGPTPNIGPIPSSFFGMHLDYFEQNVFRNAGFEPPFRITGVNGNNIKGAIAHNWLDNSLYNVDLIAVEYSKDTSRPHGGRSAQKMNITRVASDGNVLLDMPLLVVPGRNYTMTAWVRGDVSPNAAIYLGNQLSPYNIYAYRDLDTLTNNWQKVSITGEVGDTGKVQLSIVVAREGSISIDDVTFKEANGRKITGGQPWPTVPFGTVRLWGTSTTWTLLEQQRGVWDFTNFDYLVNAAKGKDIILTLGQSPAWASSDPSAITYIGNGAPAPPVNISDWINYVTKVATRYKGKIRFYEIWNEPNDPVYYSGSLTRLVQLTRTASQALKAIDPNITVISASPYDPGYLNLYLKAGIAKYVDVIGFHAYATPPEDAARQLAGVRRIMSANHVSLPLWDTEAASGGIDTLFDEAPSYIVRKHLVDLVVGAGQMNWYRWDQANTFCVGVLNTDGSLSPVGKAYGILVNWLQGASLTDAIIDSAGNWQVWLTLASGKKGLIIWNPTNSVGFHIPHFKINANLQKDIYGGTTTITATKVLVNYSPILLTEDTH